MQYDLNGKTALVTGASRGIGAATARMLAASGASVVLAARSADEISRLSGEIGEQAAAVRCDVARYEDVAAAVDLAVSKFGGLDILVNNAGMIDPIARLGDSDPEAWGAAIDVNVKGVYHGIRAALPAMKARGSGVIVNVSSGAATSPLEGWSAYCSGKAAVLMLTRMVHNEYAGENIRCVGLSPGTVATDMQRAIKRSGINPVSELDWSVHIPPEWPAAAIAWLCTDAGRPHDGEDFVLRLEENRRAVGLIA
jgi:Short-chain alcohol dehydrogenase of unknown specificity